MSKEQKRGEEARNAKPLQRKKLYELLGKLPDKKNPISAKLISKEETPYFVLEKMLLDLNGIEPVPAYMIRPIHAPQRVPVVLFNHSHFDQYNVGKNELLYGRDEMQKPPYALALAQQGYASICIDAWGFGERHGRSESEIFKEMLWRGQVMWGMMVYDNLRVIDYLVSRKDIDPDRIATMGMSMGSTMSWWLAALDERIKVCIDICCLTDFETLIKTRGIDLHGIFYYVPDLLNHFSTTQINGLICPRPHLSLAGRRDPLTPLEGLEKVDKGLKLLYEEEGVSEAWKLHIYDVGHFETVAMRQEIFDFFKRWFPADSKGGVSR